MGISARLHFQTCNKGRATKVTGAAYGSGRTRTWERAADAETHQHSQHTLCAHRGEQQREKREKIVTGPRQVVTVPSRRAGRALRSSRVECPGGPSGSQVHLRACMPMPGAAAGAQAEAGAPVRVLACKGAFLSLPLSASPCLSSVFLCLSLSHQDPVIHGFSSSPAHRPRGGGSHPDLIQSCSALLCEPRGMPSRAPSGRLPHPAPPITHLAPNAPSALNALLRQPRGMPQGHPRGACPAPPHL